MKQAILKTVMCVGFLMLIAGCKPTVPSRYIQPGELEDILYDYHLADAMASASGNDSVNMVKYHTAVLQKHGYTEADFDSSLVYYLRHTEQLKTIYENLAKRFRDESVALGGSAGDAFANVGLTGDTANVWREETSLVLAPQKPFNQHSFSLKADSAFHKGDVLMLDFNSDFIYQDGMRDGVVMLSVRFSNDSIASQTVHLSTGGHSSIRVSDDDRLGIKEVRGFFMLSRSQSPGENTTTLKLMIVSGIRLLRMHASQEKLEMKAQADSLSRDSSRQRQPLTPPSTPMIPEGELDKPMTR